MDEQSIWKKEISFGRKRKSSQPEPEETTEESSPSEPTSIWKKEISFGKKKKHAEASKPSEDEPEVVADASGEVQGSDPEPGPEETAADEQVWTRAVSFGRKLANAPEPVAEEARRLEAVEDEAEVEVQGSDHEPGPEQTAAVPVEAVADEAEAVADGSGEVQGSDHEPGPEETAAEEQVWTRAVSFGRKQADAPEPVAEEPPRLEAVEDEAEVVADASGEVQGSDPEPGPEETVPEEQTWTKEVSFSRTAEPEQEAVAAAPVEQIAAEAPTDTWSATPAVPPQPEPVVVHPPVPAAELPPEATEKVPFWKKELSFGGRKKSADEPVPETWSATPALPTQPEPVVVHPPVPAAELPLKRAAKVPFWKKELSFGSGKKGEKAPEEPKQPSERKQRQPKVKAARGAKGAKRLVGLKIGASQLAAARVANNGAAELLQVAREPLESGIVVGGELRDPDALAGALKEFFAKHKLPKKGVRLGIANNRIGVRTFDITGITDQKQLTNAIRFRAQEALPIPIDEAVLDYQVLGESVDDEGQSTKHILLVVAYRELIDRYIDACKKAGIGLVGIDLEAFALLRALQAPQEGAGTDPSAALVAVAIGHERSTFAVSDGRVCEFTRVLEWGGSALNVAIARALDAAPSEVEGAKRALALTDEMVPDGLTPEQAKNARDAMRRAIQTFARELVSSLQYYQNQPGSLGIGEIVLTGGTAHLPGLAGELERLIGVRVRVGDPLARMKISKKLGETEQIGSLAIAIGLGIDD